MPRRKLNSVDSVDKQHQKGLYILANTSLKQNEIYFPSKGMALKFVRQGVKYFDKVQQLEARRRYENLIATNGESLWSREEVEAGGPMGSRGWEEN